MMQDGVGLIQPELVRYTQDSQVAHRSRVRQGEAGQVRVRQGEACETETRQRVTFCFEKVKKGSVLV